MPKAVHPSPSQTGFAADGPPPSQPQTFSQIQVASFCLDLEDQRASYTGPGSDYPIVYCAGLEPARAVLVERPDATRPNNTEHDEGDR
jgi:hypothetical protein